MRVDSPFAKSLEPAAGHKALASVFATGVLKALMIDVNGRLRLGGEDALAPPIAQELRRASIPIV